MPLRFIVLYDIRASQFEVDINLRRVLPVCSASLRSHFSFQFSLNDFLKWKIFKGYCRTRLQFKLKAGPE